MSDSDRKSVEQTESPGSVEWLHGKLRAARAATLKLRAELAATRTERAEDARRLADLDRQVEQQREEIAKLDHALAHTRRLLESSQRSHLEDAIGTGRLEVRRDQLERRLRASEKWLEATRAKFRTLEAELADTRVEANGAESRLREAKADAELIRERTGIESDRARSKETRLRKGLDEAEASIGDLRERLQSDEERFAAAKVEKARLESRHHAAAEELESRLEEERRKHLDDLAAVERAGSEEIEALRIEQSRQLEEARSNLQLSEDQRREQTALRRGLESEATAAGMRIGEVEADLAAAGEKIAALEADARRVHEAEDHARRMAGQLARARELAIARGDKLRTVTGTRSYRLGQESWKLRATVRARRAPLGAGVLLLVAVSAAAFAAGAWWLAPVILIGIPAIGLLAYAGTRRGDDPPPPASTQTPPLEARATRAPEPRPASSAKPALPRPPSIAAQAPAVERPATKGNLEVLGPVKWADGGSPGVDLSELTVAAIMDEMSFSCFASECDLIALSPVDWEQQLESSAPDLLLVESAWAGNDGSWQYRVASYEAPDYAGLPDLRSLTAWCRERGIPSVFWNKEDPVHFERFKEAAALFDHVLTTDEQSIESYEKLCSDSIRSVGVLPFAVQQRLFHPIGETETRDDSPVFAGTYYRDRHPERRAALELLLDAARPHGLVIYDRTAGQKGDGYGYPARFEPHVRGRLPYTELPSVFRSHKIGLNANSVITSPTMFSRRVFEIVACGAAVVSTKSAGVEAFFGSTIPQVESSAEAAEALDSLISEESARQGLVRQGRRLVMAEHTYRDRLATVATVAGVDWSDSSEQVSALVPVGADTPEEQVGAVMDAIEAQQTRAHEIVIGIPDDFEYEAPQAAARGRENLRVVRRPDAGRAAVLAAFASAPRVTVFRPGAVYGPEHMTALRVAARTADSDLAGGLAATGGHTDERFTFGVPVHPDAAIARRELLVERGWPEDRASASRDFARWSRENVRVYLDEPGDAAPADERRRNRV